MRRAARLLLLASGVAFAPAVAPVFAPAFAQAPPQMPPQAPPQAPAVPVCPFAGQRPKLIVQLFFGQTIQDQSTQDQSVRDQSGRGRGLISLRAWQRFVADTITPALPSGFTVYDAYGQWLDSVTRTLGRETTKVVVVVEDDTPNFRARVAALAEAYRSRFDQHTVGIVSNTGCGVF
jgi:Protein of unknown function (DUF3574)